MKLTNQSIKSIEWSTGKASGIIHTVTAYLTVCMLRPEDLKATFIKCHGRAKLSYYIRFPSQTLQNVQWFLFFCIMLSKLMSSVSLKTFTIIVIVVMSFISNGKTLILLSSIYWSRKMGHKTNLSVELKATWEVFIL